MTHGSPNLHVTLPRCRNCKRYWRPAQSVVAAATYCEKCANDRRATAASTLSLRPITPADLVGAYLLPRKLRQR